MNQTDLIAAVTKKTGFSAKDAKSAVQAVLSAVEDSITKGKGVRTTLGTFAIGKRGARKGRNPKTGDRVDVPPKQVPYFKPGKELKDLINRSVGSEAAPD